jgi:hypothetical protein
MELVRFKKRECKYDVMQKQVRRFKKSGRDEGVVFLGVAQEKVRMPRTTRIRTESGGNIPSIWQPAQRRRITSAPKTGARSEWTVTHVLLLKSNHPHGTYRFQ